jgi:hypothetical protein
MNSLPRSPTQLPEEMPFEEDTQAANALAADEAAQLLGVSPATFRMWERRFGYPRGRPSVADDPVYDYRELVALRDALTSALSITSAIQIVLHDMSDVSRLRDAE